MIAGNSALPLALRIVIALVGGGLGALAQAPFDLSVFVLAPLAVGFLLLPMANRQRGAFFTGWLIGSAYFGITLRWITEPFQVEADIFGWMAPFALVFLATGLALLWGAGFALAHRRGPFALAVLWTGAELVRAYLFTGFPWGGFPQGLLDTPFQWLLAWVGPHGVTLGLMLLAALVAWRPLLALPAALLIGTAVFLPAPAPASLTPHVIRIVQPNAPQHEKWDRDLAPAFVTRQLEFTAAGEVPDLVLWPETAIPYQESVAQPIFDYAAEAARGALVVMGLQRDDPSGLYFNGAVVIDPDGQITDSYDKHHLVPFGEYMPFPALFRSLGIRGLAERAVSGYTPGPGPRVLDLGSLGSALPLICYEAVFPQDARAPTRPTFLMQLTNDAWFGTYAGPQQHLAQARMRAIEQGLPLVRSANTGISAMIDPHGRVLQSLPLGEAGFIDAALPEALAPTPYARMGDLPVGIVITLLAFAFFVLPAVRVKSNSD